MNCDNVRGMPIRAQVRMPEEGGRPSRRLVLVDRGEDEAIRYVTAWLNDDEEMWFHGHYYATYTEALHAFLERCKEHLR